MLLKSEVIIFVPVACTMMFLQTSGNNQDEDDFQRSNYYTNDQGNNVGEIQNQDRNSAKKQDKKVEHFRNNQAKYHESRKFNSNQDYREANDPYMMQRSDGFHEIAEGETNIEKWSQKRKGGSRVAIGQSSRGHFHIPSDRVQYYDGQNVGSSERQSRPESGFQRLVRKPSNDQGNSNWRWGFRRKQPKDHPLREMSSYAGGNHSPHKSKDSLNDHNAHCAAMVRNHLSENSDTDGYTRQNLMQSESKMVGMKTMHSENYQRLNAPRQEILDDRKMYVQAMAQPGIQWDSRERAEGAYNQSEYNIQKTELQPKDSSGWMHEAPRNAYNSHRFDFNEQPSPYRNPYLDNENPMREGRPLKTVNNQEINGGVDKQASNKPIENFQHGAGLSDQIPNHHLLPQTGNVKNYYDARKNERIQNTPKNQELQRFGQFHNDNWRYENGLSRGIPKISNEKQSENEKGDKQVPVPGMGVASQMDYHNEEIRLDDGSQQINGQQAMNSNTVNKYTQENTPNPTALGLRTKPQQKLQVGQMGQSRAEEIRYIVLTPAEFSPETLRKTLGEPEKPQGIPFCTLEEYKMESASLKAKCYDVHERDMRYNGKGSINELISRLKRNHHQTMRVSERRPVKSRASGKGPEMPVHACTATPSTREHSLGVVIQTEAVHGTTKMCWVESLIRPTMSSDDLGINIRITPPKFYEHLRGRLPVKSQFDYTAGTSCSTPCEEPAPTRMGRSKRKRTVEFFRKSKRTPDEILLTNMIRAIQSATANPKTADARNILPNALEEEKIIEKYLTALMEDQISRPKTQMKSASVGPGWLEKLLEELAENKLKSKISIMDKPLSEQNRVRSHAKLSLASQK